MGEVYRARDTKLGREVAIKVLPELFAGDAERLQRFEREAQALAALNHPNIAQIYGIEDAGPGTGSGQGGAPAIVMELVGGRTLAEILGASGALPLDEARSIACQIAEALEAAHEQGIVHRDLKPANVKVRDDGTVKVLDFGLAKLAQAAGADPRAGGQDLANSPTLTSPATALGIVLGTAAYMAPEQARGRAVDRRADIWAFGVVLFEMLSGRRAFDGETVSDVLASVLKHDLDWSRLPANLPPPVATLVRRCLTPDPKLRLRDIGEARIALAAPIVGPDLPSAASAGFSARPPASSRALMSVAAALVLALVAVSVLLWRARTPEAQPLVRYTVDAPSGAVLDLVGWPVVALSPDGRTLVFAATRDGVSHLYVRRRDEVEPTRLDGTEGATNPAFSPDGRWLAFFAGSQLKKASIDGGVVSLAKVNDPRGVTWLDDNTLVYAPEAVGGLMRVAAGGGEPTPVSTPDQGKGERSLRWPLALAGERVVLFTVGLLSSPDDYDDSEIDAVTVATGERRSVLQRASMVLDTPVGYLLFARGGSLHAQPFDVGRVQVAGSAVPVLPRVAGDRTTGVAHVAVAVDGTLAYVAGTAMGNARRLQWTDAKGLVEPLDLPPAVYNDLRIAPDGSRAAILVGTSGGGDVWIYDFARLTFTRLTFTGVNATPAWSADGKWVYYAAIDSTGLKTTMLRKPADGSREAETVATIDTRAYIKDFDPQGAAIVDYATRATGSMTDIVRLEPGSSAEPSSLVATDADEYAAAISADGRWLAYQSNETGRYEVYVRDLEGGGRWQVSTLGGEEPHWSHDGRELYYRRDDFLMRVATDLRAGFQAGPAEVLFKGIYNLRSDTGMSYDVSPRDGRFLMVRSAEEVGSPARVTVVLNWFEELGAKVKVAGSR